MPGWDKQTTWCSNFNFSDPTGTQFHHPGEFLAAGDLAIGTGASSPSQQISVGHLTGSGGVVITYSSPNINISGSGTGASITWQNISASQTLSVQNGYFCYSGGTLSLLLPSVSSVGSIIEVCLIGSTGFTITQATGQQIQVNNTTTTLGAGGSLSSTAIGNSIKLVCQTANTIWVATSIVGIFTIA